MKPGTIPPDPFGRSSDQVQMNPPAGSPNILRPAGPIDPSVGVLALEALDGRPLAVLGNYALHYVGPGVGADVTADYFGAWARALERIADVPRDRRRSPFVALLTNGCSGNINNIDFTKPRQRPRPYEQIYRVADVVAAEAYRVWRRAAFKDWVELGAAVEELTLAVRLPSAEELAEAKRILAEAPGAGQLEERPQIYARETVILAEEWPEQWKVPIQALRIGGLGIATFPGEAFVELGLEVKQNSPFQPSFLIELANDYAGYIPTVEGHRQGGYETWRAKSSFLEVEAAPKMVAAALRQLERLAR